MNHIALIPARAGSKGIPNKNLQKIKNVSLAKIAISSAKGAGLFSKIFVSTDIPALAEEWKEDGAVTTLERPAELAQDSTEMRAVVLDVIRRSELSPHDYIWLLQPTSPFREKQDYQAIFNILAKEHCPSVISVTGVGGYHPNRCYTIHRSELKRLRFTNFTNRQELHPVYWRNGCFYVFRVHEFKRDRDFFIEPCSPYLMPKERSVNIDDPMDLAVANLVAKSRGA